MHNREVEKMQAIAKRLAGEPVSQPERPPLTEFGKKIIEIENERRSEPEPISEPDKPVDQEIAKPVAENLETLPVSLPEPKTAKKTAGEEWYEMMSREWDEENREDPIAEALWEIKYAMQEQEEEAARRRRSNFLICATLLVCGAIGLYSLPLLGISLALVVAWTVALTVIKTSIVLAMRLFSGLTTHQ